MYGGAPHCPACTRVLNPDWIDPNVKLINKKLDLSTTWDGCEIASDAFVELCVDIDGVSFVPLPSAPGLP
jgi:hypothetical protein